MSAPESIHALRRRAISEALLPVGIGLLAALFLGAAAPARAGGPVVTFVDAHGVMHFTNRPHEPRYRSMTELVSQRRPAPRPPAGWQYDGLVGLTARQNDLPVALVKAVIAAESGFDPEAISRKGALGLMQLMPSTSAQLGLEDPLRPDENVRGGVRYLRALIDRYDDLSLALAAYNAGPTAVDRYGGIPPYRETRDYVKRVLTYYRDYHGDVRR
jgi:soluble lytic murein transglycosylase-like protein